MAERHTTTGRWQLGLALSLTTALMWGVLPIALKLTLEQMDAVTVTWYRFVAATLLVGAVAVRNGRLPPLGRLGIGGWSLLAIAIFGLCGNYLFYLLGLDFVSPGTAQVVIQLAPVLLLLGALAIFAERFSPLQWLGLVAFIAGLAVFFNRRWPELLAGAAHDSRGLWWLVAAAIVWAAYALAQKQLLRTMSSPQIMLCIYLAASLLFLPGASPAQIAAIDGLTLALLVFASLNTVIAYGAFAEALNHWEASRVSATVALAPLLTYAAMIALGAAWPDFALDEPINALKLTGAALVVTGSMLTALGGRRPRAARGPVLPPRG